MNPNAFLNTYWRQEIRPTVFVAMSFDKLYEKRYTDIFKKAIESTKIDNSSLQPIRVDTSKSGDSILTQIVDGISHSRLVLADISTIGKDLKDGKSFRNGNVMYEVGIALACRQPSEVVLVRDDHEDLLFDTSTIPCIRIDFTDKEEAAKTIMRELQSRIREQDLLYDARITIIAKSLTYDELQILGNWSENEEIKISPTFSKSGQFVNHLDLMIFSYYRLLDKGLIKLVGGSDTPEYSKGYFQITPFGLAVKKFSDQKLPIVKSKLR